MISEKFKEALREIVGTNNVPQEVCNAYILRCLNPELCQFSSSDQADSQARFRAASCHVLKGAKHLNKIAKMAQMGTPTLTMDSLQQASKEQREMVSAVMHAVFEHGSPTLRTLNSSPEKPPRPAPRPRWRWND